MNRRIFLTLAVLVAAPTLGAQDSTTSSTDSSASSVPTTELRVGERIRITSVRDRGRKVVGAMMLLHPDSIVLDTAAVRRSIPFFSGGAIPVEKFRFATFTTSTVKQLEVSRGASRLKGTRRGVIWGAILGTTIRVATHVGSGPQIRPLEGAGSEIGKAALSGFAAGAAIGGVLGYLLPTERWIPVQLPRRGTRGWQAP